jgi:hypothetical protein
MRDTGPDAAKLSIESMLDKFLAETDNSSDVAPVKTASPLTDPGPVPMFVPTGKRAEAAKPLTH